MEPRPRYHRNLRSIEVDGIGGLPVKAATTVLGSRVKVAGDLRTRLAERFVNPEITPHRI